MTAGYSGGGGPDRDAEPGVPDQAVRPGPLPPRFEPRPPAGPYPPGAAGRLASGSAAVPGSPPAAGWSPAAVASAPPPGYAPPAPRQPTADPGQPVGGTYPAATAPGGNPPAAGGPGTPGRGPQPPSSGAGAGQPGPGASNPWGRPGPWPGATPTSGTPTSGPVATSGTPAGPLPSGTPPPGTWPPAGPGRPPARGRGLAVVALLLVAVLLPVAGFQAYQIHQLTGRANDLGQRLEEAQGSDSSRLESLEGRAEALERQTFSPEDIAAAVLPSVFRVRAGNSTGTAFAVGEPASGGGTNLFTNYHVVESLWSFGGRQVFLERTDQRFPATIVAVDEANDVAHLRTTEKFDGLVAAPDEVRSGQQIVVVGAPLGLEDSVTTGVVSAFRRAEGNSGPMIQFDAPINPGNSGGPVINGAKEVVGIATAKARNAEGIGLAVPIKTACDGFDIC
ncbi:S1C family serine protease [Micromonospora fluostatini]|uniref:S1C family serine protease n=1 Tax=Micromonospora sp. JCM 30529 TaxID=3421643 RepID=UPI003D16DEDB